MYVDSECVFCVCWGGMCVFWGRVIVQSGELMCLRDCVTRIRWYSWLPGPGVSSHKSGGADVGQRYTVSLLGSSFNTVVGVYVDVDGSLNSAMQNRVRLRGSVLWGRGRVCVRVAVLLSFLLRMVCIECDGEECVRLGAVVVRWLRTMIVQQRATARAV